MTSSTGIRCMWMRGGTSKAAIFVADDLPADVAGRDDLLLRVLGSPDSRQIDGIGGAHPLTSKVGVVSVSTHASADVDYLFLQVGVEQATVSDKQNCGNVLAAVGPFAVERGLIQANGPQTSVRVRLVNSDSLATVTFATPNGQPDYAGDVAISGVPGTAGAVGIEFSDTEGSATSGLFPTGCVVNVIDDLTVTCIDNGMPVVVVEATSLGLNGRESYDELAADLALQERVDRLRRQAGRLMGLGDVTNASVPKTAVVSAPTDGGHLATCSFIPVRPHTAIGVLAAVSTVTAVLTPGAVGHDLTAGWGQDPSPIDVEHPSGHLLIDVQLQRAPSDRADAPVEVVRSGVIRTARKLFDGEVFPRPTSHT